MFQAHRIQNFLDTAVGSLGFCPISSVYDMAHRIGQIHFYRGVNFGADNWLVFKKVTVDQVTTGATDSSKEKDETNSNGTANGKVDTEANLIPVTAASKASEIGSFYRLPISTTFTVVKTVWLV